MVITIICWYNIKAVTEMIMEIEINNLKNTQVFADKVSALLKQINKNNSTFEQACLKAFGITSAQAGALLNLPSRGAINMNELSNAAGVDTSTMTRMVDQLLEKGLALRQADTKDRRLVRVGLTPQGQKMRQELGDALTYYHMESLEDITESEREITIQVLERLKNAVDNGLESCCNKYCNHQS
jgi:DNA-binding MarR family transcriptional regulator